MSVICVPLMVLMVVMGGWVIFSFLRVDIELHSTALDKVNLCIVRIDLPDLEYNAFSLLRSFLGID
ncbi:hypothetical protein ACFL0D_04435 [Thermoproteota archaeon]